MTTPVDLGCGHCMCRACMLRYTVDRGGSDCPLCRKKIDGCLVVSALQQRPFTRGLQKRVNTGYLIWKGRSTVHMMKRPQTFKNISRLVCQLNNIAEMDPGAKKAIAGEFERLHFNPDVSFRALDELGGMSLFGFVHTFV